MIEENDGWHTCHFCGTTVSKKGYEWDGNRHYLSDCRPDLVEHEIGDLCTWSFRRKPEYKRIRDETEDFPENHTCYAYQSAEYNGKISRLVWTDEHKHFLSDGPM